MLIQKPWVIELEYCDISVLNKPSKSFYMLKNTVFSLKIQISEKIFSKIIFFKNNSGLKDATGWQFLSPKTISHISTSFPGILDFFWKNDFFLKIEMLIILHIQCPKSANEWPIFKNKFYNILEQCLKILFNILIK